MSSYRRSSSGGSWKLRPIETGRNTLCVASCFWRSDVRGGTGPCRVIVGAELTHLPAPRGDVPRRYVRAFGGTASAGQRDPEPSFRREGSGQRAGTNHVKPELAWPGIAG